MQLGFIGTGTITAAVVEGIAGHGHRIVVSERSAAQSAQLAARFEAVTVADNQSVVDQSEVVLVGLLAQHAPEVLAGLQFRAGQRVISFVAELSLEAMAAMVAPAEAVAIMLPFPAIARGGSPILTLGDASLVREIFGGANSVYPLQSVAELNAYLCAQAVLSPAVLMVGAAAEWMAAQGIEAAAGEAFLRALVASGLQGGTCRDTLAALSTPGGYNLRLRQHMERAGLEAALFTGLDALKG
jgi:pyrroline-5-carboxylate reductase